MPVLIVGAETKLSELKPRLFSGRVSRAKLATVTEAITRANPNVDLGRLVPGTVITVPDLPEVDVKGDLSIDEITRQAVDQARVRFEQALEVATEHSKARIKDSRASRAAVVRALDATAVTKAGRADKELGAAVEAVKGEFAAEAERDKEDTALTRKAIRQWSADLDALRALAGD